QATGPRLTIGRRGEVPAHREPNHRRILRSAGLTWRRPAPWGLLVATLGEFLSSSQEIGRPVGVMSAYAAGGRVRTRGRWALCVAAIVRPSPHGNPLPGPALPPPH